MQDVSFNDRHDLLTRHSFCFSLGHFLPSLTDDLRLPRSILLREVRQLRPLHLLWLVAVAQAGTLVGLAWVLAALAALARHGRRRYGRVTGHGQDSQAGA